MGIRHTTEDQKIVECQHREIGDGSWGKAKIRGKFRALCEGMLDEGLEG